MAGPRISNAIRRLRFEHGEMTQQQLADRIGVTRQTIIAVGGLMATAQLAVGASDMGVDKVPVTMLGLTLPALTFALSLDRVLNGANHGDVRDSAAA